MPDPITDPPSPEQEAETERLAGELLSTNPHEIRLRSTASWYERWPRTAFVRADVLAIIWGLSEIDALRAKVADLSLALAREAGRRQEAERERDAVIDWPICDRGANFLTDRYVVDRFAAGRTVHDSRADAVSAVRQAAGLDAAPTPQVPQDQSSGGVALSHAGGADAPPGASQGPSRASGAEGGGS